MNAPSRVLNPQFLVIDVPIEYSERDLKKSFNDVCLDLVLLPQQGFDATVTRRQGFILGSSVLSPELHRFPLRLRFMHHTKPQIEAAQADQA